MSTIVTRAGKGAPLTHNEVDANFNNLNTDKVEKTAAAITGGSINGTTVGASTASTGAFTTLAYSSTLTGGTGVVNLGSGQFYKDASGNVGIGTTSPSAQLEVYNASTARIRVNSGANLADFAQAGTTLYVSNNANGPMLLQTNNTERMRIESGGDIAIGTTSAVNGARVSIAKSSAVTTDPFIAGAITMSLQNTSNTAGNSTSIENFDSGGRGNSYIRFINVDQNYAGAIAFGTAATGASSYGERMRIDSAGNVGIGTSPTSASGYTSLCVNNATNGGFIDLMKSGTVYLRAEIDGSNNALIGTGSGTTTAIRLQTNNTERMRIDSSGNVGIGTSSPSGRLHTNLSSANATTYPLYISNAANSGVEIAGLAFTDGPNIKSSISAGVYGTDYMAFSVGSNTERMRIDYLGNVLVGKSTTAETTTGWNFAANGSGNVKISSGYFVMNRDTDDILINFRRSNTSVGTITVTTTATAYNTSSDARLKTNVVNAPAANIDDIKVRSFDWIADGSHQEYGMVAQELLEVAPYAVSSSENPEEMLAVDYSKLVPMMVKAIQELKEEVKSLKQQLGK